MQGKGYEYEFQNMYQPDYIGSSGEAAFMTGLERNSDIVFAAAYAPLLQHVNSTQWVCDNSYLTRRWADDPARHPISSASSKRIANTLENCFTNTIIAQAPSTSQRASTHRRWVIPFVSTTGCF